MNGPTTPCVTCYKATALGGNTVIHYGKLGDMCDDCTRIHPIGAKHQN